MRPQVVHGSCLNARQSNGANPPTLQLRHTRKPSLTGNRTSPVARIAPIFLVLGASAVFYGVSLFAKQRRLGDGGDGEDYGYDDGYGPVTVCKVHVGLLSSARELQRDLKRVAYSADTNSAEGLSEVLQETVLSLMRNPEYCVYGFASSQQFGNENQADLKFNEMSLAERGRFKKETVTNVGGSIKEGGSVGGGGGQKELVVVTILVAVDGGLALPNVNNISDLKLVLSKVGGVTADQLVAMEVLWTPSDENDYYNKDDLMLDYPILNNL